MRLFRQEKPLSSEVRQNTVFVKTAKVGAGAIFMPESRLHLSAPAARVLGSLLEKETTTPEYYPLSLLALTNACNQRTSRHPVMELSEDEVRMALHEAFHARLQEADSLPFAEFQSPAHQAAITPAIDRLCGNVVSPANFVDGQHGLVNQGGVQVGTVGQVLDKAPQVMDGVFAPND